MARRAIKTMADKMAENGRSEGKDVLDDSDLSDDPIISALQTLRATIDDIQYNNQNHGTDKIQSSIEANTAKTGITTDQASAIAANSNKATYDKDLSKTSGKVLTATITESRGSYMLVFTMAHGSVTKTATIALR
jgi:hypothetical protein